MSNWRGGVYSTQRLEDSGCFRKMVKKYRYACPKDMAKNFGIASAVPEG